MIALQALAAFASLTISSDSSEGIHLTAEYGDEIYSFPRITRENSLVLNSHLVKHCSFM